MKRPYPEIGDVKQVAYIGKLAFVRKFIRYWGTTAIDGVEVMNRKKSYYKYMDDSTVKLTKHLGIHSQLKNAKMKGIKKAWLFLNANKADGNTFEASILASNLSLACKEGLVGSVVIGPKLKEMVRSTFNSSSLIPPPISTPVSDQAGIQAEILREYADYWDVGYVVSSTQSTDTYKDMLLRYMLFSTDVPHIIGKVTKTYTDIQVPVTQTRSQYINGSMEDVTSTYYLTEKVDAYAMEVSIPAYVFSDTTDIVVKIVDDVENAIKNLKDDAKIGELRGNAYLTRHTATRTSRAMVGVDDDPEIITTVTYTYPFDDANALWYYPQGVTEGAAYLRADTLKGGLLSLDQKIELINSVIDSSVRRKDGDPWEKFLAVVVIMVIIYFSAGYGAKAGAAYLATYGATGAAIISLAVTITTMALVISIVAAAAAGIGMTGTAMFLGKFLRAIAPLVTIASIITIYMAVQRLAQEGAKKVAEEGGKELAKDTVAKTTVENVMAGLKSQFDNLLTMSTTDVSMDQVMKATNMLFDAYQKQDIKDIQRQIADEKSKLAETEQAKEESKCRNLLMDLAQVQYNPLQRDYSFYDSIYDRPYERWATVFHTGNIQANMVNALWLQDSKNGIMK